MAYNLLTLFRSHTLRSEENRNRRFKDFMRWVYRTLIAATDKDVEGLRVRKGSRRWYLNTAPPHEFGETYDPKDELCTCGIAQASRGQGLNFVCLDEKTLKTWPVNSCIH